MMYHSYTYMRDKTHLCILCIEKKEERERGKEGRLVFEMIAEFSKPECGGEEDARKKESLQGSTYLR